MADLEKGQNSGVTIKVRALDFKVGAETGIVYEARLDDWRPHKPTDEWQRRRVGGKLGYDTNSCVTFSGNNTLEAQLSYLIEKGLRKETLDFIDEMGYIDDDGMPNFSDWYGANTNGTTPDGNDLGSFWDGVRHNGLLPERDGFVPNDFKTNAEWLDKSRVTQAMRDKAMRFLDFFEVKYEWVVLEQPGRWDLFAKHVKQAPLHIAVGTGSDWNRKDGEPIQPVDGIRLNHAIAYWHQDQDLKHGVLDHYDPFAKDLAWPYYIPYAIKGVLYEKAPKPEAPGFDHVFSVNMRSGWPAIPEVRRLQEALQLLGYMPKGVFGPYGPQTTFAVAKLQAKHKIVDPGGAGVNFGPKTRAAINAEIAAL